MAFNVDQLHIVRSTQHCSLAQWYPHIAAEVVNVISVTINKLQSMGNARYWFNMFLFNLSARPHNRTQLQHAVFWAHVAAAGCPV